MTIAAPYPYAPSLSGISLDAYRPASGDHLCSLWTDGVTDRLVAARFLGSRSGGERALWILDPPRGEAPSTRSGGGGDGVSLYSTDYVHLDQGRFDPERMRRFWRTRAEELSAGGVSHLRAVAEMTWALRGRPGTEEAPVFESSLTPTLLPLPLSVICQYGSTRFNAETLLAMVLSHPLIVIGETVLANPYAIEHDHFPRRFAVMREEAPAALMPIWLHFLHRLPSLSEIALCLCNALPALVGAERVWVMLTDLPSWFTLDVGFDRVESVAPADFAVPLTPFGRLHAMWPGTASSAGAAVTVSSLDDVGVVEATFEPRQGRLVAQRRGGFTSAAMARFTTTASALATLLRRTRFLSQALRSVIP